MIKCYKCIGAGIVFGWPNQTCDNCLGKGFVQSVPEKLTVLHNGPAVLTTLNLSVEDCKFIADVLQRAIEVETKKDYVFGNTLLKLRAYCDTFDAFVLADKRRKNDAIPVKIG